MEDFSHYNGDDTQCRKAQLRLLDMLKDLHDICEKHGLKYFLSGGTCLGAIRHGGFIPWDDDLDIDMDFKDYKKLIKILKAELPGNYFLQLPETDEGYYQIYCRIVDKNSYIKYPEDKGWLRRQLKFNGLFIDIFPIEKVLSYKFKKNFDYIYGRAFMIKRGIGGNIFKRVISYFILPILELVKGLARFSSFLANEEKMSHIYGTNLTPKLKKSNLFPTKKILFEGYEFWGPANPHQYLTELYGNYMEVPNPDNRIVHSEEIVFI